MSITSAIMEALRGAKPLVSVSAAEVPHSLVSSSIHDALAQLQVEHPVPWSNRLINTPWADQLKGVEVADLDKALGQYSVGKNKIALDPEAFIGEGGILGEDTGPTGILAHETQHFRDDLAGGTNWDREMELPYGRRPHERRAFTQEFADVHNINSRLNGQPNLLPDRDIKQLAQNITHYGLDTHEAIQALRDALEQRGSFESALPLGESLTSWRRPRQERLPL